jgi:hypothetical protein
MENIGGIDKNTHPRPCQDLDPQQCTVTTKPVLDSIFLIYFLNLLFMKDSCIKAVILAMSCLY